MRVLQLWVRLFFISIGVYIATLVAVEAGAASWLPAASMWVVISVAGAGAVVVAATVLRVATLERRLSRAIAARHDSVAVAPYDVMERAFGPLVESHAVRELAAAVIRPGRQIIWFPAAGAGGPQSTLYEIGSLTKPMTAELLATMVLDGTSAMETRIGDVLSPPTLPNDIASITLADLVTHQSGLPRLPRTLRMTLAAMFSADPYRWLSDRALLQSLASARRTAPRGTYSNFGFAILGHVLGQLSGDDYRRALESRLLQPLGLHNTYIDATDESGLPHARGHDLVGVATPRWRTGAIAGAGGVSMTISDAAAWLAAHVEPPAAFRDVVSMVIRPLASLGLDRIGMGWVVRETDGRTVVWHNGGTGGFSSFAAFEPARRVGVIALAASTHMNALDRAGFQVLRECAARWGVVTNHSSSARA